MGKCKQNFGGELSTIATLMFAVLHVMLNSSALLNLDHKYPSPLTWIHRCVTFCNAPFSRRQSIPELVHYNFGGELSIVATLMFAVLHVLLNSFALLTLSSHITYTHVNTKICILLQCTVFKDAEHSWKVYDTFNTARHCLVKSCQMKHRNAE